MTELNYFIFKKPVSDDKVVSLHNIDTVSERAFANCSGIEAIYFDKNLTTVEKEALKDCSELQVFCCEEKRPENKQESTASNSEEKEDWIAVIDNAIYNFESEEPKKNFFTIQANAFDSCKNLHTVILPKVKTIVIEKEAFTGCEKLRTVVALSDEIEITGNPFESCPDYLTFVCYENSKIERFARENSYRYINVQ